MGVFEDLEVPGDEDVEPRPDMLGGAVQLAPDVGDEEHVTSVRAAP
jgi:hypothetical protein